MVLRAVYLEDVVKTPVTSRLASGRTRTCDPVFKPTAQAITIAISVLCGLSRRFE